MLEKFNLVDDRDCSSALLIYGAVNSDDHFISLRIIFGAANSDLSTRLFNKLLDHAPTGANDLRDKVEGN